ncbi:MAG TPA: DUF6602 domain-containing protein [Polyangiaceae bacterium]|nr:DUF6602 domain-containing protein [Polyangiaceae bacterium]
MGSGLKGETGASGEGQRKRWLAILLDRMTAPADVMRQHLGAENQNSALGSAAEAGVRDLLGVVLPQRLAVTSGFLREPGRSLAEANPQGAVSPQTDVIIYDRTRSTPLHSAGGVEIVAAPDVVGIIEVKDAKNGSEDLASAEGEGGALGQMKRLALYSPFAFRGIVLFRGKAPAPKKAAAGAPEGGLEGADSEVELTRRRIEAATLQSSDAPHVIYCSSCVTGHEETGAYVAFYDFFNKKVCVQEYPGDRTSALAAFLRVVTGYFAAQGLISPSLHLDLLPAKPERKAIEVPIADLDPVFESLHGLLLRRREVEKQPFHKLFLDLLKGDEGATARAFVATGRDASGLATAGVVVLVTAPSQTKATLAAFFYLAKSDVFLCTDASAEEDQRWEVEEDDVVEYVRRVVDQSGRVYDALRTTVQQDDPEVANEGAELPAEEGP